jgi:hypothetical protein
MNDYMIRRIYRIYQLAALITCLLMGGAQLFLPSSAAADAFFFATGAPNGLIATGSAPSINGSLEIESADDFVLNSRTVINQATFTGLLTGTAQTSNIGQVTVEIYRVFPNDSVNPPSGTVPTRVNSPSDVAFAERTNTAVGGLTVQTSLVNASFTAANSVLNGIHPIPNQTTGGEGAVTGREVQFTVNFTNPLNLPADHYFFVPQVQVSGGNFLWLSGPRPIVSPDGTPFTPDLQSWIRNGNLDPNWLRIGTDIVGGASPPTFNASFSLSGTTVPEPSTWLLLGSGLAGLLWRKARMHSGR